MILFLHQNKEVLVMYVKAYAKINAYLDVIGKREDGYHDLDMVMLPLELHDSLQVTFLPYSNDSYVVCDHVELQETKYNLINQTLLEMKKRYKIKQNFSIIVHKEIPISAGLGGGSSNAAATIRAICQLLKLKLPKEELLDLAKSLGADVPFCLDNVPARVSGIGENLKPIKLKKKYYVLIIKPEQGLSTKHVFDYADTMELDHGNGDKVEEALVNGDDTLLAQSVFNSLEKPSISLVGKIQEIKDMFRKDGLDIVLMSGSGSAVFALHDNHGLMQKLYKKYEKQGYDVFLTKTL